MEISKACVDLVKLFEGCKLKAYKDIVGVWTIGWGHTVDVKSGDEITQHQADVMLEHELGEFATKVDALVKYPVTQNQFDALVCFAYNVGVVALGKSTLLKKLNAGDVAGATKEFLKWNKAGGKIVNGLTRRRIDEQTLFMGLITSHK